MRFDTPLTLAFSLLAATASASNHGPGSPGGGSKAPNNHPVTTPEAFVWRNPYEGNKLASYKPTCSKEASFPASEFLLHDLYEQPPIGLWPWADLLKKFFQGREYPGGWDGKDPHGYDRPLLKMDYIDIPKKVREWIEVEEKTSGAGKGLFAVYEKQTGNDKVEPKDGAVVEDEDKVAIFAPGALYGVLPLWVAEDSDCQGTFSELKNYALEPEDAKVIAWVTEHTKPNRKEKERDTEFTVKVEALKRTAAEDKNETKDEL